MGIARLTPGYLFSGVLVVLLGWLSASPAPAAGQSAGNNAVYTSPTKLVGSTAFIDASVLTMPNVNTDICARINDALMSIPTSGAVIDARGINSNMSCPIVNQVPTTPWVYGSNTATVPSVILLPAGTITIAGTWILPSGTRIIGEGASSSGQSGTVLLAASNFPSPMIQFGLSNGNISFGISVEGLTLNGNNQAITGILNASSDELTYIKSVSLYQILGVGLSITTTGAGNSGPYSDIRFNAGATGSAQAVCAQILDVSTRGIHGLTCISPLHPNSAAVLLDGPGNSIEDVHIDGFSDGIRIGSQSNSSGGVIFNVTGASSVTNVVHIYGTNTTSHLTIMQVATGGAKYAIEDDDQTPFEFIPDSFVAMYALGEPTIFDTNKHPTAYSRFTTSPSAPTWFIGVGALSIGVPCGTSSTGTIGSLYSNTAPSGTSTLWACAAGTDFNSWTLIK
jgi:hypothetical protein